MIRTRPADTDKEIEDILTSIEENWVVTAAGRMLRFISQNMQLSRGESMQVVGDRLAQMMKATLAPDYVEAVDMTSGLQIVINKRELGIRIRAFPHTSTILMKAIFSVQP